MNTSWYQTIGPTRIFVLLSGTHTPKAQQIRVHACSMPRLANKGHQLCTSEYAPPRMYTQLSLAHPAFRGCAQGFYTPSTLPESIRDYITASIPSKARSLRYDS